MSSSRNRAQPCYNARVEIAIERLVALCCFVVGLSHIVQPRAWVELFIDWRKKGVIGVFYTGLLHFALGALIVAFHNVWGGFATIVTVLGWAWVVKGLVYLTFPSVGMRSLNRVAPERAWEFVVAGFVLLALSALITYSLFVRGGL